MRSPSIVRTGHVEGSTPYPWPYDADLSASRLALVVVGWDRYWWGACDAPGRAVAQLRPLVAAIATTVVVRHGADVGPLPPDADLHAPTVDVAAFGVDGFHAGPLDAVLRGHGVDHLVIAGSGLEGPVHSTLRSANDRGYECLVALDACSAVDPSLTPRAVSMIEMSGGIFGAVATTDQILAALSAPDQGATLP